MGDEAEIRTDRSARFSGRIVDVRVIPPDDDEYVAIRATDLVGKELQRTDDLGPATARLDHGFVVIEYPGLGPFHRTLIREEAWVRVKRRG